MKKGMKHYQRHKNSHINAILFFIVVFILVIFAMACIDKKIFDIVIEISHIQSKNIANGVIDRAVKSTINEMDVSSNDFFTDYNPVTMNSISANTMLINDFCSTVSSEITKSLNELSNEKIRIPLGVTTGIDMLANSGPEIAFSLRPAGAADVDYETGFEAVGINQTNFKIWINVTMAIQIVNPLRKEKIVFTRKIMLVDTVISGEVPDHYLNFGR